MDKAAIYADPNFLLNAKEMGRMYARSGLFGLANDEQGFVFAVEIIVNRLSPFEMMQTWHVLGNKVTKQATAMLTAFNELGGTHKVTEYTPNAVTIVFTYQGNSTPVRITYEEALAEKWPYGKGGKIKDNWNAPLQRASMLFARVTTRGIRAVCPKATEGSYAPEEIDDDGLPAPNYSTFGCEPSLIPENVMQHRDTDPCLPDQLETIQRCGNEVSQFDPEILNKVKSKLNSLGKSKLAELNWKEANELAGALHRKIVEHQLGESLAGTPATG